MKLNIKTVTKLLIFLSAIGSFISCENPLEGRVNDLEEQLEQQKEDQIKQQATLDSLFLVIRDQNSIINSMIISRQRIIDSLSSEFNQTFDSLNSDQKAKIDSLINNQNNAIDSMYAFQQNLIESIIVNQVNSEFLQSEVFNGVCPQEWTDLDVSSFVGREKTLLIFRVDRLSEESNFVAFRPNGETVDWLSEDSVFVGGQTTSLSVLHLGLAKSGLIMILSDDNGIVEFRANRSKSFTVPRLTISVKLEYYLN